MIPGFDFAPSEIPKEKADVTLSLPTPVYRSEEFLDVLRGNNVTAAEEVTGTEDFEKRDAEEWASNTKESGKETALESATYSKDVEDFLSKPF